MGLVLLFLPLTVHAFNYSIVDSGTDGSVTWEVRTTEDGSNELVFRPTDGVSGTFNDEGWVNSSYHKDNTAPWNNRDDYDSIRFEKGVKGGHSLGGMFFNNNAKKINLTNFDTSNTQDMTSMFRNSKSTEIIGLNSISVSSVEIMDSMFKNSEALELDITGWDVYNLYYANQLFRGSKAKEILGLKDLNVSSLGRMNGMFAFSSVTNIDLSNWDTSNVEYMQHLFSYSKAKNINISGKFTAADAYYTDGMFAHINLDTLDISNLVIPHAFQTWYMFGGANIKNLIVSTENKSLGLPSNLVGIYMGINTDTVYFGDVEYSEGIVSGAFGYKDYDLITMLNRLYDGDYSSGYLLRNLLEVYLDDEDLHVIFVSGGDLDVDKYKGYFSVGEADVNKIVITKDLDVYGSELFNDETIWVNFGTGESKTLYDLFNNPSFDNTIRVDKGTWVKEGKFKVIVHGTGKDGGEFIQEFVGSNTEPLMLPASLTNNGEVIQVLGYSKNKGDYSIDVELGVPLSFKGNPNIINSEVVNLYVVPENYLINYDSNGGLGSMSSSRVMLDEEFTIPSAPFSRFNHRLLGYSINKDSDTPDFIVGQPVTNIVPAGETITLYAVWEPIDNSVTIDGGEFSIQLKGGEQLTLKEVPAGVQYEVYEETPQGWVLVESINTTGEIKTLEESVAKFINDYRPGQTSVVIKAVKLLDEEPSGNFEFVLLKDGQEIQRSKSASNGSIIFDPIILDSAGSYRYQIEEVNTQNPNIDYDSHTEEVVVNVVDNGDGTLSSNVVYSSPDGAVFNNTTKKGSLMISKQLEGSNNVGQEFNIRIRLSNGEVLERKVSVNNPVIINDLPYGTTYTVEEYALPVGYQLSDITNSEGEINSDVHRVVVQNQYSVRGSVNLEARKIISSPVQRDLIAGEFEFQVVDDEGRVLTSAVNDGDGNIYFDAIDINFIGTKNYTIREVNNGVPNIVYDDEPKQVVINTVDRGDGSLEVSADYPNGLVVFNNKYTPDELPNVDTGEVVIRKRVVNKTEGNKDAKYKLMVELIGADGRGIKGDYSYTTTRGTNGYIHNGGTLDIMADEEITISGLPLNIFISIEEEVPAGYHVSSDSSLINVLVKDRVELEIVNHYNAVGKWTPNASKRLNGANLSDYSFNFLVLKDGDIVSRGVSDDNGTINFEGIQYTIDDVDKEYEYTIVEESDSVDGITYDSSEYSVLLVVKDDGKGNIYVDVKEVRKDGELVSDIVFKNIYRANMPATGTYGLILPIVMSMLFVLMVFGLDRKYS